MKKFCVHLGVIVLLATGAGLIRSRNLTWIPNVKEVEAQRRIEQELHDELRQKAGVTLERFQELICQGAVVIDARPAQAFEEGHLLIDGFPPVLNVPSDEFDQNVNRLLELVGLPLVLYCTSNDCDMAEEIYPALKSMGFTDIWIYFPGYAGILENKLPTIAGPDTWTGSEEELADDPAADEAVEPSNTGDGDQADMASTDDEPADDESEAQEP